jgi:hypothetical protein
MPWTEAEDEVLRRLVAHHGDRNWSTMVEHLPSRSAKQIRERWHNQLDPKIRKTPWTEKVSQYSHLSRCLIPHCISTGGSDNYVGSSGTGQQVCQSLNLSSTERLLRRTREQMGGNRKADSWTDRQRSQKLLELRSQTPRIGKGVSEF